MKPSEAHPAEDAGMRASPLSREATEIKRLRGALAQVRMASLLRIRQAAFGPEIGVRYTEAIRAEIANECARLEQFIDATLKAKP